MQEKLKAIVRDITPPAIVRSYSNYRNRKYGFHGDYPTWEDACHASSGYDDETILKKIKSAALKVKRGEAALERDSVLFENAQYSWPLLAGLFWIATANDNQLRVLDYGGSLGSSYYQNRSLLTAVDELKWCIVEQEKFVECGKKYFEDEYLTFYYDVATCLEDESIDVVLMSSVLPYLEKPYGILNKVMTAGVNYIIIDRTPFLKAGEKDRLTIQHVLPSIYKASYPAWFFNKPKFMQFIKRRYHLIAEFECQDQANIKSEYKGFIFAKHNHQN